MIQFLLAAPRSGSGKTTMTCALLMALKRRGCAPCAFKSGPDYIDPMFHRAVLGVESCNLDLFFSAPETVRTLYAKGAAGHGAAVCEGAMGFYDGLGGVSDRASAWHLADTLDLPVLLVVEPKGQSLTLAAELNGLVNFRTPSHIAGILLNNCTARMHALLAPMLEKETGLPVLGFLPKLPEAVIGSRHLGLYTAAEVENLQQKLALLADAAEEHIDWPRLLALCEKEPPVLPVQPETPPARVRIAVAQDEAFCFTYAETLASTRAGVRRLNELAAAARTAAKEMAQTAKETAQTAVGTAAAAAQTAKETAANAAQSAAQTAKEAAASAIQTARETGISTPQSTKPAKDEPGQ